MDDIVFKAVAFVEGKDTFNGQYFYNAPSDSAYGHIYGVKELTISKAITILNAKGIDPIKNIKVSIMVYYNNA